MELKNKTMVFLGDSITEGVGTTQGYRYWELVAQQTGAVCKGYGFGGSCIARQQHPELLEWNGNIRRHFVTRVEEMDRRADVIVALGGVNDFGHGDAPVGSMEDRTENTFYGALHDLYTRLIQQYPDGRVIVMTPLHCTGEQAADKQPSLVDYVSAIRQVAEFYSLPVVDLYANSGIQPGLGVHQERYMPDGLHPNEAGHRRIAELLVGMLKTL